MILQTMRKSLGGVVVHGIVIFVDCATNNNNNRTVADVLSILVNVMAL